MASIPRWAVHALLLAPTVSLCALAADVPAQEGRQEPDAAEAEAENGPRLEPALLRYGEHRDLPVARLGRREITLEEVLAHVEDRHAPGLRAFLESPGGLRELNSPLVPLWVRLYTDLFMLREEAAARGLSTQDAETAVEQNLRLGFEAFQERFTRRREREGNPIQWTPEREAFFLRRFRREEGLKAEIKSYLDLLVPDRFTESELRHFHAGHGHHFGGEVLLSHILIRHRDPGTGRLYSPEHQDRIRRRLEDIRSRIRPDGINFAGVAQRFSQDVRSGRQGGELGWFTRLDQTLPAVLVREAWRMDDGEWSGPHESPEGLHFVRRDRFHQQSYLLYLGDSVRQVRAHLRTLRQEDLIFELRRRRGAKLLL